MIGAFLGVKLVWSTYMLVQIMCCGQMVRNMHKKSEPML